MILGRDPESNQTTLYMCGKCQGKGVNKTEDEDKISLQKVSMDWNVANVAVGFDHSAMLLESGEVKVVGRNVYGQLGCDLIGESKEWIDLEVSPTLFKNKASDIKVTRISCGSYHTSLIAKYVENGKQKTGLFYTGSYGRGTKTSSLVYLPVPCANDDELVDVKSGQNYACVLTRNGCVFGFGRNASGQLGIGPVTTKNKEVAKPTKMKGIENVKIVALSCGGSHTALVTSNHMVLVCGDNGSGQLGLGDKKE